jgi:hypothetical protein
MPNLFEKLGDGRPRPTSADTNRAQFAAANVVIKPHPQYPPVKKLRDWLVHRWPKDVVTTREVRIYGPYAVRDGKIVLALMQILTEQKWLVPIEAYRRNTQEWKIIRRPTPSGIRAS